MQDIKDILQFLTDIAAHNDREWFNAHRDRYDAVQAHFSDIAADMITRIGRFEPAVVGMPVKSTLYRIYRDTRFSLDKSPYKRHFGTYINPMGKKSIHGGYYLHLQPSGCFVAVGSYGLPSPVLRAVRQSIVAEADRFHSILTEPELADHTPILGESHLKTVPAGFPRDFAYPEYLRPREYDLSIMLEDSFFTKPDWPEQTARLFQLMKPFLDFVNETVDDYI